MNRIDQALDLSKLTVSEKDGLILRLATRVKDLKRGNATLGGRVSDLEGRLREPAKTPDNSSAPPSTGDKANRIRTNRAK